MKLNTPVLLLVILTLLSGCTREETIMEESGYNSAALTITVRASRGTGNPDTGEESEKVVNTLRLMVFNPEGTLVANELYSDTGLDALKETDGTYTFRKRIKANLGIINICLVANEPATWTQKFNHTTPVMTYQILSDLKILYDQDYNFVMNNGNRENLNLYTADNTDYFLMYGEKSVSFIAGDVDAGVIGLDRTVAKVTLSLKYPDYINGVDYNNGESFALRSAAIMYQPLNSTLINRETIKLSYEDEDYLPTQHLSFITKKATAQTYTEIEPVVFYIPEYYLSQSAYDTGLYTYIEVLGDILIGGVPQYTVSYKIPLGEGVQKLYDSDPNNNILGIGDYSIVRNHHYAVNGTVGNLGEKNGIRLQVLIKDWQDGGTVNAEDNAPYLNVSDIMLEKKLSSMSPESRDKIFFWSNQPLELISLLPAVEVEGDHTPFTATYYDQSGAVINTSGYTPPQIDVSMTKYSSGETGYFENNGYVNVTITVNPQYLFWDKLKVSYHIKAGNLRRTVTIIYQTEYISS